MSPRPYRMAKRQVARAETRQRILEAVRHLLSKETSTELSMEAVARRADISRLTIYYQFGSRAGLLEALYDDLATRGHMQRMAEVFQEPNPQKAIRKMIEIFVGFWATDPAVMRRLRAMGALDEEIGKGIQARDERRPPLAREILKRAGSSRGTRSTPNQVDVADVLSMLTSFESYDALAKSGHADRDIIATLTSLAVSALDRAASRQK